MSCPVDHEGPSSAKECPVDHQKLSKSETCPVDHGAREQWLKMAYKDRKQKPSEFVLSSGREVSSIPKGEKGQGNWIYPSQEQFYNALVRKNRDASPEDMQTIVPIHNAVNERAWFEIMRWERDYDSSSCGGPRLVSFQGDASKLSPRARFNKLLGYSGPFDRHDWVVDRCGTQVEYVIDFYAGQANTGDLSKPSFYLDVRPKLNSVEGVKMRLRKFFGM
ncbi:hypothetical protein CANCADRAFT_715 [Tortispora caseinolytica NRRL Y-17796]|uniref:Holocytochrome c-type synthase n=1 Tax=Tortispora caseinolytica NRRL Y-17796 TaxID=767744 RepID=A0A1E4TK22_9ASCO|nr:hypothetical protein CANCADRAFT_715 [Tortispora caseinolytica NRRL Y-17796]